MIQNDDIKVRFTIKVNGATAVISSISDYQIYIYSNTGSEKKLLMTCKKSDTGITKITVDDDAAGKVTVVIPRSLTKLQKGKIYAEVKVQLTATSDYINGKANTGVNDLFIEEIKSSSNPNALA